MKVVKHELGTWFIRDVRRGQASLVVNVIGRPVCPSDILCRTDVGGEPCIGWASGASLALDERLGEPCNCTSYRSSDFGFHRLDRLTARALGTQIFFSLMTLTCFGRQVSTQ